jgi:hypothetical protein
MSAYAGWLPANLRIGIACLVAAAALLGQGLLRDLWQLRQTKQAPGRAMLCMCAESTLGIAGVVAGMVLVGAGIGGQVSLPPLVWTALTGGVLLVGIALRDWVIRLRPIGIVHIPDHGSVRVTMR